VPNALNFGFAGLGACLHLGEHGFDGLVFSVGAWLIALVVVFVPFLLRLYRGGDAKLVMAIAAWLGPRGGLNAFVYGVVLGGVVAVVTAWLHRRSLTQPAAERPDQAHAPMAVAFALGALAALQWPLEGS
jgi:Flp pilus assembly protein protease CpaA